MKSQRCFDLMWLQGLSLQVATNSSNGFSSTLFSSSVIDSNLPWSELQDACVFCPQTLTDLYFMALQ